MIMMNKMITTTKSIISRTKTKASYLIVVITAVMFLLQSQRAHTHLEVSFCVSRHLIPDWKSYPLRVL